MANQDASEHAIIIHSLVSDIRKSHKKVEENLQRMKKILEETRRTDYEVELVQASVEKLIHNRLELKKLLENDAVSVFLHLKNQDASSRLDFLNGCVGKFKNLYLGNQETKSDGYSGDQEKEECSKSPGYVADDESELKYRTLKKHLYIDVSSGEESSGNDAGVEYSGDYEDGLSIFEELMEDLKKQDEGEDK